MPSPLVVALDFSSSTDALALVDKLDPSRCRLKVGKEVFTHFGPDFVRQLVQRQFDVFLDLKFHDIPTTVAKACQAAADLGVWMINVHALGGPAMLKAARDSLSSHSNDGPLLIAVTILTNFDQGQLQQVGISHSVRDETLLLAKLAHESGCDGVVASPQEVALIKKSCPRLLTVTPGIRMTSDVLDDQNRIMTPRQAIEAGSDYLVIGRPITQSNDPMGALARIESQLGERT